MERGLPDSGNSLSMQGRFMYADYSPLEDDRNLVDVIKEYVALASKIGRLDVNNRKLSSLASDSDRLRQDIIASIKHIKTDTTYTMEKFHDEHADLLSNELLTKGAALLLDTKKSLSDLLANTESGFDEQHSKYREKITARVIENNNTATTLVQAWLSGDHRNLPRTILSHLDVTIRASLDKKTGKNYDVVRIAESATAVDNVAEPSNTGALQFSYSFSIDPTEIEFWNFRRNVMDLGIKDLLLPIGMNAPISEKIKQKFRFGSRKDTEVNKEPDFVKADGYYLVSATLQGGKTLIVELSRDASGTPESDAFRISYDIASLLEQDSQRSSLPRIDYTSNDKTNSATESDLLQIAEVKANSDLSKLRLLGAAVLSRFRALQDPKLVSSRGKLVELRINSDDVIIPSSLQGGDYNSLFKFLVSVARSYSPFVKKMQEKTSVNGELTLREEIGGGQRKEYSVRIEDLKTQLRETENGKSVALALGI